jgi:glycosyltransferase involved in cell wall biosynthesis
MKKGVLFVGSFKRESKGGHVGGQMFACNSLLNSSIKQDYNWFLIDSTSDSVVVPTLFRRTIKAFQRVGKCLNTLLLQGDKINFVLIFTSDGFSFIEKGLIVLISKIFGKKTVLAPRSGLFPNDFKKRLFKQYIKFIFQRTDVIICQGQSWKDFFLKELKDDLNPSKLIIINNWINPDLYKGRIKVKNTSKVIITYIGWFEKYKGINDLVTLINLINADTDFIDKVEFRLAGKGSCYDLVCNQVREATFNNVKILGWVKHEQKDTLLTETDIYVQLSHAEGFPNSVLEAMASGKAVLCTDVGAVADLVKNKYNGYTVRPGDIQSACEILKVLINNQELRIKISQKAYQTVRDEFILENAIIKLKSILN